jgi:hypothetical protein
MMLGVDHDGGGGMAAAVRRRQKVKTQREIETMLLYKCFYVAFLI